MWPYAITADERIMELDYDKVLFETDSKWQNIKIMNSKEHGAVLFLDGDLSMSSYIIMDLLVKTCSINRQMDRRPKKEEKNNSKLYTVNFLRNSRSVERTVIRTDTFQ